MYKYSTIHDASVNGLWTQQNKTYSTIETAIMSTSLVVFAVRPCKLRAKEYFSVLTLEMNFSRVYNRVNCPLAL